MPKFRRKPVILEAEQFRLEQARKGKGALGVVMVVVSSADPSVVYGLYRGPEVHPGTKLAWGIKSLEGWHLVQDGDWIVTGIHGERWAVKPDIFELTYEPYEPAE